MNETKQLVWAELWAAMDANPDQWIETTEEMYWEMLEVLPPRSSIGRNFLVGEALRDNSEGFPIYSCFTKSGDTYKAKNLTYKEFMDEFGHIPAREMR